MPNRTFAALAFIIALFAFALPALARPIGDTDADPVASDVILVLPFENTSTHREFNWVGESFADELGELLNNTSGLASVPSDEREIAYQKLRLPLTTLPSRATTIKLALEAKATLVVFGTYEVTPAQKDGQVPALHGTARIIRVKEGRLLGEQMPDGRWASNQYDFGDAITNLQTMLGQLAYQILYQRDKTLPFSMNQFIERATKVPPRAFEAFVKGKLTADKQTRSNYLQNALREYAKANGGTTYPQAAFELGMLYFEENNWQKATQYLSLLQKKDPHYAEAAFYSGLSYWRQNDLKGALGAYMPLAADMPLTDVFNNTGAIAIQAARGEKAKDDRERMLMQALKYLARAAESAPDDPIIHFNYAYALFLNNQFREAANNLKPVLALNSKDGEAQFILAKAAEKIGDKENANKADNEARKYNPAYAQLQTAWQKDQTPPAMPVRLRLDFNRSVSVGVKGNETAPAQDISNTANLLAKARELYASGNDDEALIELRRVLTIEPMSAQAYLLIGRINLRRGDLEAAISSLKTAMFWEQPDSKMIDARVLLGRIFLERGDRTMALNYARNALQIDPNNQEAIGLQRQVELGGK